MAIAFTILGLVGGLVLFLYGMDLMGDSLKKLAGGKLESILARLTSNRFLGFLLGFLVTAVIQSSSATTVMLVGFVNSGIMTLSQTIAIIMGANIGTTVTAWLLSTNDIGGGAVQGAADILQFFKPSSFTPVLALIGFLLIAMAKSDNKKNTGSILLGFAILMFGMDMMSDAMGGLKDNTAFTGMLTMFENPIMGILVGTIFTVIIQSSSASIGVLQALAMTPGIHLSYATAIPVILGQNIGTTVTPIISSVSGNLESKRVAMSCLYIKMIGVAVVTAGFYGLDAVIGFDFMTKNIGAVGIAFVHTLFNIISTVILIPFCSLFEKLAVKTVRSRKEEKQADIFAVLDDRFLAMPGFAVEKSKELVDDMLCLSRESFKKAVLLLDNYDPDIFAEVQEIEGAIDKYEDKIGTYLIKIAETPLSTNDSKTVSELLHCIGDIERISDHALNIAEATKEIHDKKINFSEKALEDIRVITAAVSEILELSIISLTEGSIEKAAMIEPLEQVIDRLKRKIKTGHIDRLRQGDCTVEMGFVLSDLLTNYERIADHCSNIAVCMIEINNDTFETHEYLSQVKSGEGTDFVEMYENYKQKYALKQ